MASLSTTTTTALKNFQNGVMLSSQMHYGPVDPSTTTAMSSSIDSLRVSKRPTNLEVNSTNDFTAKKRLEDNDNIDDGSLPCTPELQSDSESDVSSCPAGDEVLDNDTRQIIIRFLRDFTGLSKPQWIESKAQSTMRRVVEDLLEKHRIAYNGRYSHTSWVDFYTKSS